eukprot:CAMPEP_0182853968 /NCGR_PEP_ID=MMETSP0034_2-20130328/986_1 /TAXON_ID=156128 /ORGANISM="Nephroselmis pyriformis, Strain CCMP717" /LENGTH=310 /DNA_ID=CAMNT_0024984757 /DNA_START=52 /DNA_END=980 /DNA_ORIENTATION=+
MQQQAAPRAAFPWRSRGAQRPSALQAAPCRVGAPRPLGLRPVVACSSSSPEAPGGDKGGRRRFFEEGAAQTYEHVPPEVHPNFQNSDFGSVIATAARVEFLREVEGNGEAYMDLAMMAMQVAVEDDALVTNSCVALPVEPYLARLQRMADEIDEFWLPKLPEGAGVDEQVACVAEYLWEYQKFRPIKDPLRSEQAMRAEHPGVWTDERLAYLNHVLTRKVGSSAALAVCFQDVWKRLLLKGAVGGAIRMEIPRNGDELPLATALPGFGRSTLVQGSRVLNTCTSEALVEMLRLLKRAFWPWAWDTALDGA